MTRPDPHRGLGRLFPHLPPAAPHPDRHRPFLLARLLEEGDSRDLAWLTGELPEEELVAWLAARGGRALSHRSRVFWELVLGTEAGPAHPLAAELWPH